MGRHSRERIPPAEYLAATYYEKWLRGLEMLLVEQGLVTAKELQTGRAESKASGVSALRVPEAATLLRNRRHARRAARRRGAGLQGAVGGAGLRNNGFPARARRLHLARMGGRARRRARRRDRARRAGRRHPLLRALAGGPGKTRRREKTHPGPGARAARG